MRILLVLAAVTSLALSALPALANGAPVKINLTRLAGVVNFGGPNARGTAEITAVEGDSIVTVTGLERLGNELYQGWLFNSKTGERLSVTKFNVTADGTARNQSIVAIGNREFDLFVITVEPEPDPSPEADPRIVLAGYWPGREPQSLQATALAQADQAARTSVPPAATIVSTQFPTGLPRTGGPGVEVLAGALALLGLGAAVFARQGSR